MAHWQSELSVLRAPLSNANSYERTKDTQNKAFGPELMNDQDWTIENLPNAFNKMNLKPQESNGSRRSASEKLSRHTTPLSPWSQPQQTSSRRFAEDQWIDDLVLSGLKQPDLGDVDDEYDHKSEMTYSYRSSHLSMSDRPSLQSHAGSSSHRSSSSTPSIAGIPEVLPKESVHINDLPPEMVSELVGILTNEVPSGWGEPAPQSGRDLRKSESLLHERRDIVKTIRFTGNVAWFQGTDGFITMNINGERVRDFFCHWSEIRACVQGRKSLGESEAVEFMLMDDNKGGFKCKDVTGPGEAPVEGQDLRPKPSMRQNRPRLAKVGECYEYHEGKCNRAPGHCRYSHDVEPARLRISRAEAARHAVTEIPALAYHTAPFVLVPTNAGDLGLLYNATSRPSQIWETKVVRRASFNASDLYAHGLSHLAQYPSHDFYLQ